MWNVKPYPSLKIKVDDGVIDGPVFKWFDVGQQASLVVLNPEYEEHDVWLLHDGQAYLMGTLTDKRFAGVSHARKGTALDLTCDTQNFEWLAGRERGKDGPWHGLHLRGKGVSVSEVSPRIAEVFTYVPETKPDFL